MQLACVEANCCTQLPRCDWRGEVLGRVLLLLAALCLGCLTTPVMAQPSDADRSHAALDAGENNDVGLYRDIAQEVREGGTYYSRIAQLHRERGYPLKPAVTVRLPTLAYLTAVLGSVGLLVLAGLIVLASLIVWYRRDPSAPLVEKALVAGMLSLGGAGFLTENSLLLHGAWCGLLLTLALGLLLSGRWWPALAVATLALAIREFAIIFIGMLGLLALIDRDWKRVSGAIMVGVLFAVMLFIHAAALAPFVLPGDLASPPWQGLRGPEALVEDLMRFSYLGALPFTGAALAIVASFAGWATLSRRSASAALIWFGSAALLIMIFARENNFYWATIMLPGFTLGMAFLVGALVRNWRNSQARLTSER